MELHGKFLHREKQHKYAVLRNYKSILGFHLELLHEPKGEAK
jgi:hypothetical protein